MTLEFEIRNLQSDSFTSSERDSLSGLECDGEARQGDGVWGSRGRAEVVTAEDGDAVVERLDGPDADDVGRGDRGLRFQRFQRSQISHVPETESGQARLIVEAVD